MPLIMFPNIDFDTSIGYYISLHELREIFPHLEKDKEVELYFIELRNEQGKLVKRFKLFRKLLAKTGEHYQGYYGWVKHLCLPQNIVSSLNIGRNYKMVIILIRYDNEPLLPFEVKAIGYEAQKVVETLSNIDMDLLLLHLEQPILNKVCSYLWDSWFRLEENDIEGSRTAIRNSLEVLEKEFLPNILAGEESSKFPDKLKRLIISLRDFLHYGGPHPGPAPRTTTEMILSLTINLVKYLTKSIENKVIIFQEG
ncbi:MAG: hypothetical protein QW128_07025 [Thermoprotei archaeon]